ncbi:MAG: ABC transporter ATP-binding protein/permease [Polyangiaceae bacterium]|nr:ABC transporter ATP-binding protein/permease [Polyangiaceae bacterium]
MSTDSILLRFYLKDLGRRLHGAPGVLLFALAVTLHALGHALVALVGSALAASLALGWVGGGPVSFGPWHAVGGAKPAESQAFLLSLVGLGVVLVKGASGAYATYVQVRVAGEVGAELRLELFDALLARHPSRQLRQGDPYRDAGSPSRAVMSLVERVHDIETGLSHGLIGSARAVAQLVPLAGLLAVLSPRMAAVAALVLASFGWGLGRLRAGYRAATLRRASDRALLAEASDDSIRHAELWVSYGAEAKARAAVDRLGSALVRGTAALETRAAALSGANEALAAFAVLGALAASRAGWLGAVADGATLLAFTVTFFLAYRPLRELGDARLSLARAGGAYEELRSVTARAGGFSQTARVVPRASARLPLSASETAWLPGALELRHLGLVRGGARPLSMRIEAGAVAVVVGPTGIGKTTLLRTLLGLEPPRSGDVVFAGQSLAGRPPGPASRPFAWVPQDAPVLSDTLSANVALGDARVDVEGALAQFGADHLVRRLGGGRLGAGGRSVSGGERQWIALARAVATRQPVLLLDEPTSGLDAAASRAVLEAIRRMRGARTVLLVTHRPEPLAIADVIVHLDDGTVERAA